MPTDLFFCEKNTKYIERATHDTRSVTSDRRSDKWRTSSSLSAISDVCKHSNNSVY